jgi:predicted transposase YbfD/YdcC
MDKIQYNTLTDVFKDIPDPRHARGKRYSWVCLLTLMGSALASGQKTPHAIAYWIALHATELKDSLPHCPATLPSESTIRRTLRMVDIQILEERLACFAQSLAARTPCPSTAAALQGQSVDGKQVRSVRAHGGALTLVSLVQHQNALVLGQVAVDQKSNEISAVPQLLAGRNLQGTVTTMDALLTQRSLAQQILRQQGHYLMTVKANQPELVEAIGFLFEHPPWKRSQRHLEYRIWKTENKGHGRREERVLESSSALREYLDWPGAKQVLRRRCRRISLKSGQVSRETTYAITSLSPEQASAAQLEKLWRGHWTIENRVHYVRDVTMGEDTGQMHASQAQQVLAALRNAILNMLRVNRWTNIADALRYYGASVPRALQLIGAMPT